MRSSDAGRRARLAACCQHQTRYSMYVNCVVPCHGHVVLIGQHCTTRTRQWPPAPAALRCHACRCVYSLHVCDSDSVRYCLRIMNLARRVAESTDCIHSNSCRRCLRVSSCIHATVKCTISSCTLCIRKCQPHARWKHKLT